MFKRSDGRERILKRKSVNCKNERKHIKPYLVCKCSQCRSSKEDFNKKLLELKRKHFRHFIQKVPSKVPTNVQDIDDNSRVKEQTENTINPIDLRVIQTAVKGYFNLIIGLV